MNITEESQLANENVPTSKFVTISVEKLEKLLTVVNAAIEWFEFDKQDVKFFNPKYFTPYNKLRRAIKDLDDGGINT